MFDLIDKILNINPIKKDKGLEEYMNLELRK